MPAFFLALICAALATLAGREAVRVARLAQALGSRAGLLLALWLAAIGASAVAGWFGDELGRQLTPAAKHVLLALALLVAAGDVAFLRAPASPREATRSLGAILLVLLGAQLTDAARLLVAALAASTGGPWLAAAGGALGSGAVLTAAWALGRDWEKRFPVAALRWTVSVVLLLAAMVTGVTALGLLG